VQGRVTKADTAAMPLRNVYVGTVSGKPVKSMLAGIYADRETAVKMIALMYGFSGHNGYRLKLKQDSRVEVQGRVFTIHRMPVTYGVK
jgi:hypothetical protein